MTNKLVVFILAAALTGWAQVTPPANDAQQDSASQAQQNSYQVEPLPQTPTYKVNVVERTTQAVDYRYRGGSTDVNFHGTDLMPGIEGKAKIEGKVGRLSISANLHHMRPARDLGLPYLTYVLWAVTPDGRPVNLGELIPDDDGNAKIGVTTSLNSFGLIVTAEPYFAVTRPSTEMVAENIVPEDVKGFIRPITAKFDLMDRGQYMVSINSDQLPASNPEAARVIPLQLLEARDAVAIARASGAEQYASDTLAKAVDMLNRAEDYFRRKQGMTPIGTAARSATQSAEDARLLTINKKEEERATAAREQMQQRIEHAQSESEANAERAELARKRAEDETAQRQRAEEEREAAQRAAQEAEQARLAAEQAAQQSQQQLAAAQQQQQQYQQEAQQARLQAQQAEQARQQIEQQAAAQRQRLVQQLNTVLQTKDTARGVVAQMSDVLFDVNKSTLKPDAKIRLAKVAGIVMAYPDLKLEIDGYTDSTGTAERNEVLSQERAAAVRDFLISQGVPIDNVSARGFGEENPIASNETSSGRRLNRRVELVLNGTAIGQNAGASMPNSPAGAAPAGQQPSTIGSPSSTTPPPAATSQAPPPKR